MHTLSVVISVFNGERFLEDCLSSVKPIASEIIVVDHESTDKTVAIAKKFTKHIYTQKNNPDNIDMQKNFGFEKATSDWVLSLDADEKVSPELAEEIESKIQDARSRSVEGYFIPRKNIIFNTWIEHTGWYPDYQLRLFRKGKGKYVKKHVHEHLVVGGTIEKLNTAIIHEAYQTIQQFIQRGLLIYAPNEAEAIKEKGYVFSYADSIRFPVQEFLSRFFARQGYKDGFHGLVLSLLMAIYHFAIFAYLWEKEKFPDTANATDIISQGFYVSGKEFRYWMETARIEKAENTSSKLLHKAKRKLGL